MQLCNCSQLKIDSFLLSHFESRYQNHTATPQRGSGGFSNAREESYMEGLYFQEGFKLLFSSSMRWDCSLLLLILGKFPNDTLLWQTETQELSINQNGTRFFKGWKETKLFYSQDLSSNSPYCLLYNSHDVSSEICYWINPQSWEWKTSTRITNDKLEKFKTSLEIVSQIYLLYL